MHQRGPLRFPLYIFSFLDRCSSVCWRALERRGNGGKWLGEQLLGGDTWRWAWTRWCQSVASAEGERTLQSYSLLRRGGHHWLRWNRSLSLLGSSTSFWFFVLFLVAYRSMRRFLNVNFSSRWFRLRLRGVRRRGTRGWRICAGGFGIWRERRSRSTFYVSFSCSILQCTSIVILEYDLSMIRYDLTLAAVDEVVLYFRCTSGFLVSSSARVFLKV